MLRHKNTIIISEITDFFTTSEKAIKPFFLALNSLTFSESIHSIFTLNNLQSACYLLGTNGINDLVVREVLKSWKPFISKKIQ